MKITPVLEQFIQIAGNEKPVRDGDLIHKDSAAQLMRAGWITRVDGWNFPTLKGFEIAKILGYFKP